MTIFCPALNYRATRWTPNEWCENEVTEEGDFCPAHEEVDRSDEEYERFREDQRRDQ